MSITLRDFVGIAKKQIQSFHSQAQYSYRLSISLSSSILGLIMFAYIASHWVEQAFADLTFNTLPLRIFVALSLVPLLFQRYWPSAIAKKGPLLTTIIVGILFPFCFGTILILDAAYSPPASTISYFAVSEYILSLFLMVQILFHLRLILLVWGCFTVIALLSLFFIENPNIGLLVDNFIYALPFFLTILLVGGIINRNVLIIQNEREQAVWNVSNAIAHQLRTPLATIRNLSNGGKSHFTRLTEGYKQAYEFGLIDKPIQSHKFEILEEALESITDEVAHSNALIDILIANSRPFELLETPNNQLSMRDIINRAVETFPYNNPIERGLVKLDLEKDFQISALENMVLHVLYNLIGNAVEFSQKRKGGEIKIWLEADDRWNSAIIWDSGVGIPQNLQHLVFEPFFSRNSPNGTGIGLSFCKSVMEGLGGRIICESEENSFCKFTLEFPKVRPTQTPAEHSPTAHPSE